MGNSSSGTTNESLDEPRAIENEIELMKTPSYYLYALIITSNSESKGEQVLEYKSAPNLPEFSKYGKFVYKNVDLNNLKKVFSSNFGYEILVENAKIPFRLRHPNILGFEKSKYKSGKFCLTTEYARPLSLCLSKLTSEEIYLGMHDLLESLQFIHNVVGLSHNNVSVSSIFVSGDGSWKLSCFELAKPIDKMTQEFVVVLESIRDRSEECNAVMFSTDRLDAYDIYCTGHTFISILKEYCKEDKSVVSFTEILESKCLIPETKKRFTFQEISSQEIFNNPYVEITVFLRNYSVKSLSEKQDFFRKLPHLLLSLPEALIARRLVHKLLARIILVDPLSRPTLQLVLTPYSDASRPNSGECLLQAVLFQRYIIPLLEKIFLIREYFVRTALLSAFPHYFKLFDKELLKTQILPKIRLGLQSENPNLVAATLHCMGYMVPLLGPETVTGVPPTPFLFPEHGPKLTSLRPPNQAPRLSTIVNILPSNCSDNVPKQTTNHNIDSLQEKRIGLSWNVLSSNPKPPDRSDDLTSKPVALIAPTTSDNYLNYESQSKSTDEKQNIPDDEIIDDDEGWDSMWPEEYKDERNEIIEEEFQIDNARTNSPQCSAREKSSPQKSSGTADSDIILDVKSMPIPATIDPVNSAIEDLFADMQPVFKPRVQSSMSNKETTTKSEEAVISPPRKTATVFIENEDAGDAWTEEWDQEDNTDTD